MLIICLCALSSICTYCVVSYRLPAMSQQQNVYINQDKTHKVNINKATREELKTLPGVGERKAQLIIDNRPYVNIYDLTCIRWIGDDTFNDIKELIEVD